MMAKEVDKQNEDDDLFAKETQAPLENHHGDDGIGDEFKCEECGPRRVLPDPGQPTQSEIEEHRIDHLPYRSWCPECVAGRATGEQHRARRGLRAVPVFSFDYLFITKSRKVVRELAEGEEITVKIIVATESYGKSVFAHTVDVKGPGEDQYAVDRLVEDLKWLGFSRVSLRSDNEPAILKLLEVTLKNLRVDVLHDEPGVAGAMGVPPDEEPSETPEASGEAQAGSGGPPRPPRAASGPEQVVQ